MIAFVLAVGAGIVGIVLDAPWLYISMAVLIIVVVIDAIVIINRKRRGEPG